MSDLDPERAATIRALSAKLTGLRLQWDNRMMMNTPVDLQKRCEMDIENNLLLAEINDTKLLLDIETAGHAP